jgi:hypothetical protein
MKIKKEEGNGKKKKPKNMIKFGLHLNSYTSTVHLALEKRYERCFSLSGHHLSSQSTFSTWV